MTNKSGSIESIFRSKPKRIIWLVIGIGCIVVWGLIAWLHDGDEAESQSQMLEKPPVACEHETPQVQFSGPIPSALKGAKETLQNVPNFAESVTDGIANGFEYATSSYATPGFVYQGDVVYFGPNDTQKEIMLQRGAWSPMVRLPPEVDYRIDVSPPDGYRIKFIDGTEQDVPANGIAFFGIRRAVFQLQGKVPGQTATITTTLNDGRSPKNECRR
ncbi:MAG: hypothetical protein AAB407_01535 [Patescibacteria group bacterium]